MAVLTAIALLALAISGPASALATPSSVLAWGWNGLGQLGDGTTTGPEECGVPFGVLGLVREPCSTIPVPVSGLSGVTSVAAGGDTSHLTLNFIVAHSLALLSNGTVMAWGDNRNGELGDGAEGEPSDVPVAVSGLGGATAIAAGGSHSLALRSNGTVVAWGNNSNGELGDGAEGEPSDVPVAVSGLSGVTAVAAGETDSLALLSNGTVMAWGGNFRGQLGAGAKGKTSDVPVPVSGLSGVVAIASGGEHNLALLSNGTVMAWGDNGDGELGDGAEGEPSDVPVPVTGLSGVTAIAAGESHSIALLSNGTVLEWGTQKRGELSSVLPAGETRDVPKPVSGLAGVMAIAAGEEHSLALLRNGTVMTWGFNEYGQLGDGASAKGERSEVPVPVNGLAGVTAIAGGGTHSLAISAAPTVTAVEPDSGPITGGTSVTITGVNFTGVTAVRFGSANAAHFTIQSATSITAVSPPGRGTVDVAVTNAAGTGPVRADDHFSYKPTVTAVRSNSGPTRGRTLLTITGTNFTGATAVKFGAANALRFRVTAAGSITALSPAGAGTVNVTVITPGGTSALTTADQFTYATSGEWTIFPAPALGAVQEELKGISCVSLRFCVAVGHRGQVGAEALIESWNGSAWSMNAAPPTPPLYGSVALKGVSCVSATFCLAIGRAYENGPSPDSSGPRTITDTWNGTTWSEQAGGIKGVPDEGDREAALNGASCVSPSFCLAVGSVGQSPSETLVASWNGETWKYLPSPNTIPDFPNANELSSVSCVSLTFCMAVGSAGHEANEKLLAEAFNGTEVSVFPTPTRGAGGLDALNGVSCVNGEDCVAVGVDEGPLVEDWNGSMWSIAKGSHPQGMEVNAVSCVSAGSCTAVGSGVTSEKAPSHTLVGVSKGGVWSIVPSANGAAGASALNGVSCVAAAPGWKPCFAAGSYEVSPEGPLQALVELGEI